MLRGYLVAQMEGKSCARFTVMRIPGIPAAHRTLAALQAIYGNQINTDHVSTKDYHERLSQE